MTASLARRRHTLAALCVASVCWAFSFGLGAPLASIHLEAAGFSKTVIGLNTSLYYLGIAVAAVLVPRLLRRWGHGVTVVGMAASGLTVALFPWSAGQFGWHLLRLLNGVAGAMSLIPVETLVNRNANPQQRARDFGCYAFSIALGMALGNVVGTHMYAYSPVLAFAQGGLLALVSAVVVLDWLPVGAPLVPEETQTRTPLHFRRNFLSFGSGWIQGFLEGGMVALLPLYLLAIGFSADAVGWLLGGTMLGVILFQVPVAWLADRFGRTSILLGCYVVTGLGLVVLPLCGSTFWLAVWLFLTGACSGALYPLGLAVIGERTPTQGLARANAWFLAINCLGSLTGPLVTGVVMDWVGQRGMFVVGQVALFGVLGVCVVVRSLDLVLRPQQPQPRPLLLLPPPPVEEGTVVENNQAA